MQTQINSGQLAFPILECFHIAGFALSIGVTALVDFRLLGFGLRDRTPAQIPASGLWLMFGGLVVAIFSGFLIYSTDPDMYYFELDLRCQNGLLGAGHRFQLHDSSESARAGSLAGRCALGGGEFSDTVDIGGVWWDFIAILEH